MIVSYPSVDEQGNETLGQVSIKFSKIVGIGQLHREQYNDNTNNMNLTIVPNCCVIFTDQHEFFIKANYEELINYFKRHNEMYELI